MNIQKVETTIAHPLDDIFDVVPNQTIIERTEIVPVEPTASPVYDAKDNEIETKLEDIYTIAMEQALDMGDQIGRVEGKYKARMGEVSATMLNVALGAIREKSSLKMHKDKLYVGSKNGQSPHTVNNNLVVADRNEIMEMIRSRKNT